MVFNVLRIGVRKSVNLVPQRLTILQNATITGRTTRGAPLKIKPYHPYLEKPIGHWTCWNNPTLLNVEEENAKVVVVEGPIAAGKTALCEALAKELDMVYMPPPTMDEVYVNDYGYDLRQLDHMLPESVRSYDHKNFCQTPKHQNTANYQNHMLVLRFCQYIDALAHVLNSGQGVILERSAYSDKAFAKAMTDVGYIRKEAYYDYLDYRFTTIPFLMKPHLIIYLDIPESVVRERIKARNISWEVNSKAFTPAFLNAMEKYYKEEYLKEEEPYSHILMYDWSDGGEVETVVEDIEKLHFYQVTRDEQDKKFRDWRLVRKMLKEKRMLYTNNKVDLVVDNFKIDNLDTDELFAPHEDIEKRREVYQTHAKGMKFLEGFNPQDGDNVWFKGRHKKAFRKICFFNMG